jgi:serine/threonine-protein kinase
VTAISYQIQAPLSQLWARVDLALDSQGRRVALKRLPAVTARGLAQLAVLQAPAWEHPRLLRPLEVIALDGQPTIVTEYLGGGSLWPYVSGGRAKLPSLAQVRQWALDLGAVLDHLHGLGVVHRRVSYNNVLFDESGGLHLADSYMQWLAYEGKNYLPMRPLALNAPETFGGEWWPASDQYSAAMLLYELLTGVLPFEHDSFSPSEMLHHVLNDPAPPLSHWRPDLAALDSIFEQALAKAPDQRFESVGMLMTQFDAVL